MNDTGPREEELSLEDLALARRNTEAISRFLQDRLLGYVETLRYLLLPERALGKHVGFKGEVPGIDKALAELHESYKQLAGPPFNLPREFEADWLSAIGTRLELHRWEYSREIKGAKSARIITIASPVRWILTYSSPFSVAQMGQSLSRKESRMDDMRQFVVKALVLKLVVSRNPGLQALFEALGYTIRLEPNPSLPNLPLVVFTSRLPSFRPSDDLVSTAVALSGVSAFIELIDVRAVEELVDPIKQPILDLVSES